MPPNSPACCRDSAKASDAPRSFGPARSVIDWRGQAVSAQRQTGLLQGVPVLVAWGAADTTIPPHHHQAFAARVPEAVTVKIAAAGHYPHETDSAQLLEPMLTFLSSTVPFEYSESWVDRLTRSQARAARRPSQVSPAGTGHPTAAGVDFGCPVRSRRPARGATLSLRTQRSPGLRRLAWPGRAIRHQRQRRLDVRLPQRR